MTGFEMNAHLVKKIMINHSRGVFALGHQPVVVAGLCSILLIGLSGCANSFAPKTDMNSPVAPQVQATVDAHRVFPHWSDFPSASANLPEPAAVAARVNTLQSDSRTLGSQVAAIQWDEGDAEARARDAAARVEAAKVAPIDTRTAAETEAFAQGLRDRAKAPPAIPRR